MRFAYSVQTQFGKGVYKWIVKKERQRERERERERTMNKQRDIHIDF